MIINILSIFAGLIMFGRAVRIFQELVSMGDPQAFLDCKYYVYCIVCIVARVAPTQSFLASFEALAEATYRYLCAEI